jgi:error-prone DNA polymerase
MLHVTTGGRWADLHVHTAYSLLDGASQPAALATRAAALGYPALALTDHDSLAALVAHARACAAAGIRAIAGVELTLEDDTHLTLLARDTVGSRSLCRLVSTAQLAGSKGAPRAMLADVAACSAGLECLTGCRKGAVAAAVLRGDEEEARRALDALVAIFGAAHTHVEVQRARLPDDGRLSFALARLAHRAGLPLVATGNAHYAHASERDLQDVLVCLRERLPLAAARPYLRDGAAWCLRSQEEMARLFRDLPTALEGAAQLAEGCAFDLTDVDATFPPFPVPAGQTQDAYLAALATAGARERYGAAVEAATGAVAGRLAHELRVITHLGLASYILTVWDIVRFARDQGLLCQGRGSAVGSLVCYALGITAVEPLAHGLSFERFLSVGRTDPPDIDVDFPSDRDGAAPAREAVLRYALERYQGHAALVSTHVTFRAKSALREVGMALGLAREQLDALSDQVEHARDGDQTPPSTRAVQRLLLPAGAQVRRLQDLCARLEGLPRHLGQHPGGVVITARPLAEVAPLEHARMEGRIVTQWDKEDAETVGLAKIDLLGLGMLGVLERCFALLEEQTGTRPALHAFRCDDPRVYDAFCRADTVGVFQLESRAQMSACLPYLQPRRYEDLIVAVALIRPGPVQANAVHPYLRRRQGLEPVTYPGGAAGQRLLAPVLEETLGVCLFQDQVIGLARAAGLSPDEAAEVRRAMSSGRSQERMAALRARLSAGLAARGLDQAACTTVVDMVQAFASYGFLKGHAAAFAYLAYVSCWLKVYHPTIFLAALLNSQPMGYYSPEVLLQDAERHGVRVLPVDLWRSRRDCTVEDGAVRLGWRLVAGLGPDACARLEEALPSAQEEQPDLEDLCVRACLEEDEMCALARAGALRRVYPNRRQALWQAPLVARLARSHWLPGVAAGLDPPVTLPAATVLDELQLDRAALGLSLGGHVLSHLRSELARYRLPKVADLLHLPSGLVVDLAGQVLARERPGTARGVTFLSVSDETGLLTVVVLPPLYARDRAAVRGETLVWVRGVLERRGTALTVRAKRVRPLATLLAMPPRSGAPAGAPPRARESLAHAGQALGD